MKILIVNHNDKNKGTFFRCLSIGQILTRLGNQVSLSCYNPDKRALKIRKSSDISGVKIIEVAGSHTMSSVTELPYHFLRAFQNIYIALTGRFDIVMFSGVACPTTGLSLIFVSFLKLLGILNIKIIVDWDDLWGKDGLTSLNNKGSFAVMVADFMETRLPKLADIVTVVSHNIYDRALSAGIDNKKILYLPNGTNITPGSFQNKSAVRKSLGIKESSTVLFFVGRALWTFDYLIASFKIIVKKYPKVVIIYVSPLQEKHIKTIEDAGLKNNLIFVGIQPYEKLLSLISASDVALLPRENSEIEKANFPTRLCDYISMGKPIVASSIGDEVEYIFKKYHCGLLAKHDSPKDFADKIINLIENKKLREKIGNINTKVTAKLSLDKYVGKLNKIITKVNGQNI